MANDVLSPQRDKKRTIVDIVDILNNSSSRARLQNYIDEVVICKTKILDQNHAIKDMRDAATSELGIHPKMFAALVSTFFNNNFDEKREEYESLLSAIEVLMQVPALKDERPEKDS